VFQPVVNGHITGIRHKSQIIEFASVYIKI